MGIKTKLKASVYRKASNNLTLGDFICRELEKITTDSRKYKRAIERCFEPDVSSVAYFSFDQNGIADYGYSASTPLGSLRRKIALDLMAELIETGDINDFI